MHQVLVRIRPVAAEPHDHVTAFRARPRVVGEDLPSAGGEQVRQLVQPTLGEVGTIVPVVDRTGSFPIKCARSDGGVHHHVDAADGQIRGQRG
jgi:hypothetical protein